MIFSDNRNLRISNGYMHVTYLSAGAFLFLFSVSDTFVHKYNKLTKDNFCFTKKINVMAKKVAVVAVNPVNGFGLFEYLETFYENGIPYKVFAVADSKEIKSNSGIALTVDDAIADLKGHEDEFDALVFACGDAVPVFQQNAGKPYNADLMAVLKTFGEKGKIMIGHCAAAMMFDFAGITAGRKLALHPLAKPAIQIGKATDEDSEIDGNFYTAKDEHTIRTMLPGVVKALKK